MTDLNSCSKCGGQLPNDGALGGGCPRCMLELGFDTSVGSRGSADTGVVAERPAMIGRYRILRLIGEGGMGAVYEAEQAHPCRTVALKIIKSGLASPELLRRFEQESQALGRLQHPGIAQIYDAGTVDTGFGPQPYFAMELIRGRSPRDYAEAKHWSVRERLQLMVKICDAVHHAHQRGLIHRDLKPGNILVDESGQPKILDFGVARVTNSDTRATLQTDMGQLIGTLAYMSPEQALADPLDIDTRSDVYSLGVILYELLSGRLPYTISKKIHEAIHAIREEDPARLSTSNRMFRGDIETIVAKALEKDRGRRYASAAEVAADIQRYLHDEPIVARPASARYQLEKFARRNKALVGGVVAVFAVLLAGVVTSMWFAIQARNAESLAWERLTRAEQAEKEVREERDRANINEKRAAAQRNQAVELQQQALALSRDAISQRERADNEAAIATEVQKFLANDLLRMADPAQQFEPSRAAGLINDPLSARAAQILTGARTPQSEPSKSDPNITVKELLDRAARRIGDRFDRRPLVEAAIRETIAETYFGLGAHQEARNQFEQAVALRRREQGSSHPQTLNSTMRLANVLFALRLFPATENLIRRVVEDDRKGDGRDNPATRSAITLLLSMYTTVYNQEKEFGLPSAEALVKDVIDYDRRRFGADNPTIRQAIPIVIALYKVHQPPRYSEAEAFLKQLLADQTRTRGDENATSATTISELVRLYMLQGKNFDAERLLIPLVSDSALSRILQLGYVATKEDMSMLGRMSLLWQVYGRLEKTQQADVLERAISILKGIPRNSATVSTLEYRDPVSPSNPMYSADEAALESLIGAQREHLGPTHAQTMTSMLRLAEVHATEFAFYRLRGEAELARLAGEKGAEYYKQYLAVQRTAPGAETSQMTRLVMLGLASIQATLGNYTDAELLTREVLALQEKAENVQQASKRSSLVFIGWLQFHRQRYAEAEATLREVWDSDEQQSWARFNTESMLGAALAAQGKYVEAEPYLVQGYEGMLGREPQVGTFYQPTLFTAESEPGERIVNMYQHWGKADKVAEWRQKVNGAPNFSLLPWSEYLQR